MRRTPNRTKFILTLLAVGLVFLTWSATTALAGGGDSPDDAPPGDKYPDDSIYKTTYQTHVLVVKMYPQFSAIDITGNGSIEKVEESLVHSNTYLVEIVGDADPEAMAADLEGQSGIAYAHPNYILNALHPVQGSIPFSDEVHIGSFEGQEAVVMTNLGAAHTDATGDQITVAVIDGGVDFSHPALDGMAVSGYDYVDFDDDAYDEPGGDASGHGTFVAGLVHLVAPDATIRAYRIMDANGGGDGFTLARAIERAVDDGCDVINLSVVLTDRHLAVQDAINYAASNGVIVVAAAGNDAIDTPVYPAAEPNTIAVAALDTLLQAAEFTNFGSFIDVCAPGVRTYSAYQADLYAWWDGTSFAAPFVAGEAALLRQDNPTLLASQIEGKIIGSAQSVDPTNPDMIGKLGSGLIDPSAALEVTSGSDTAMMIPNMLLFTHIEGIEYFTAPEQSALLLSSNAPADYSIKVIETTDTFVSYYSGTGQTNDSIYVSFDAGDLPVGDYYNQLEINVDGVSSPAMLVVHLQIIPEQPIENEAHFTPSQLSFTAQAETDPIFYGAAYLTASNATVPYTTEVSTGYVQFVNLIDSSGIANDSIRFEVDPGKVPGPGLYIDTIICWVEGVIDPAKLLVNLTVEEYSPQPDTLAITPLSQSFELICYTLDTLVGQIAILYEGAPHRWAISEYDSPEFLTLHDSVGYTSDSAHFVIRAGSLEPGDYSDSVQIYVEGLTDVPVIAEVNLHVQDSTEVPSPVFLSPPSLSFTVVEGTTEIQSGCTMAYIPFSNPPPFPVWFAYDGTFATVVDTIGDIRDSICIEVDPSGFGIGSYSDTILVALEGYFQPAKLPVHLFVESSDTTSGPSDTTGTPSLVLTPPGGYYISRLEGSTEVYSTCNTVLSSSDGAALSFTGTIKDGGQFTELLTTSGVTPDPICFNVDPTGFTLGDYVDTLFFTVAEYELPAKIAVHLHIGPADTVVVPTDSLVLTPQELSFTIDEGSTELLTGCAVLWNSDGAILPYTAGYYYGGPSFFDILTLSGVTPDTVCIQIDPTGMAAGVYFDAAGFTVEGYDYSALLDIRLTIVDPNDSTGIPGDTTNPDPGVVIVAPPMVTFYAAEGSSELQNGYGYLWSVDSVPAPFTGYVQPGSRFTELLTPSGYTFDSVSAEIDPVGLSAGEYYDSVYFDVEGFEHPALWTLRLIVNTVGDTLLPTSGTLSQNYPNPFNPTTTISFDLSNDAQVSLDIYNVLGRKVTTLINEHLAAGEHSVKWDASRAASGIYFYRLNIGGQIETRKMVLLR